MDSVEIVFPIRFATRNAAVQTTTRELGTAGVRVRCLEPPEPGTQLALKLYLPGSRDGVEAAGVVEEVFTDAQEAGFRARFTGLSAGARERIEDVLGRRERAAAAKPIGAISVQPLDGADDARRAFPRHNARFAVRFATVQDFVLEYAANISAGGVFVSTSDPPPLETVVRVEMELPGAGGSVPARALVVHRVTEAEARERGTTPGMGVQFIDADDGFRERVDAAIEFILSAEKQR